MNEEDKNQQASKYPFDSLPMMKQINIQMNLLDGSIDFKHDENLTYSEVLGMIEYAKMMIMHNWLEDIK